MKNKQTVSVTRGSGNVFADLGFSDAAERLRKAELAHAISVRIQQQKLTQVKAAAKLGIDQPKVSALMRGRLEGFSTDRLISFLNTLGCNVKIIIDEIQTKSALMAT